MPNSTIFQSDLFEFLRQPKRQPKRQMKREWFAKNKWRCQQVVLEPTMQLIGGFAPQLAKLSPHLIADASPVCANKACGYVTCRFCRSIPIRDSSPEDPL